MNRLLFATLVLAGCMQEGRLDLSLELVAAHPGCTPGGDGDPLAGVTQFVFRTYEGEREVPDQTSRVSLTAGTLALPPLAQGSGRRFLVEAMAGDSEVRGRGFSPAFDLLDSGPIASKVFLRALDRFSPLYTSPAEGCHELPVALAGHTATALPDGRVLIAGGYSVVGDGRVLSDATFVYLPSTGELLAGPRLPKARAHHTASLLPGTRRVLLAGGTGLVNEREVPLLSMVEVVLDEVGATGTSRLVVLREPRFQHVAAVLPSGRLLLAGGTNDRGEPLSSTEVFDPASSQSWEAPRLPSPLARAAAVRVGDRIAIVGGYDGTTIRDDIIMVIEEPSTSMAVVPAGKLPGGVHSPALAPVGPSSFLVIGGQTTAASEFNDGTDAVVLVDLDTSSRAQIASLGTKRARPAAVVLADAKVLVLGGALGWNGGLSAIRSIERLSLERVPEPAGAARWTVQAIAAELAAGGPLGTHTLLPDGTVFVAGGLSSLAPGEVAASKAVEIFQPTYRASASSPFVEAAAP